MKRVDVGDFTDFVAALAGPGLTLADLDDYDFPPRQRTLAAALVATLCDPERREAAYAAFWGGEPPSLATASAAFDGSVRAIADPALRQVWQLLALSLPSQFPELAPETAAHQWQQLEARHGAPDAARWVPLACRDLCERELLRRGLSPVEAPVLTVTPAPVAAFPSGPPSLATKLSLEDREAIDRLQLKAAAAGLGLAAALVERVALAASLSAHSSRPMLEDPGALWLSLLTGAIAAVAVYRIMTRPEHFPRLSARLRRLPPLHASAHGARPNMALPTAFMRTLRLLTDHATWPQILGTLVILATLPFVASLFMALREAIALALPCLAALGLARSLRGLPAAPPLTLDRPGGKNGGHPHPPGGPS